MLSGATKLRDLVRATLGHSSTPPIHRAWKGNKGGHSPSETNDSASGQGATLQLKLQEKSTSEDNSDTAKWF